MNEMGQQPLGTKEQTTNPPSQPSSELLQTVHEGDTSRVVAKGYLFSTFMVHETDTVAVDLFKKLSILDRILTPVILIAMVVGVIIGEFAPNVQRAFDTARFDSVSARESSHSTSSR
jgi:hypothetical protein